jgi:hypothetical protein
VDDEETAVKIDLYASRPHYASHMLPIRSALPVEARGRMISPNPDNWWACEPDPGEFETVMVAGYCDLQAVQQRAKRIIYVEHGAGQTYPGDPRSAADPSYSGGIGHERVLLHVCPSETVADRWRNLHPALAAVAVGAPILDPWHCGARPFTAEPLPTVVLTFHWDCGLIPETRSAYRHYEDAIGRCVAAWRAEGFAVAGHGHPRVIGALGAVWAAYGVPTVNMGWVYDHADLLIADNTSVMYEFASLGRDVLCLNAPWYRRDVEHGLRFWSHPPGHQANNPDQMLERSIHLLRGDDSGLLAGSTMLRAAAVSAAYCSTDGYASMRAARAILEVLDERRSDGGPLPERGSRSAAHAPV